MAPKIAIAMSSNLDNLLKSAIARSDDVDAGILVDDEFDHRGLFIDAADNRPSRTDRRVAASNGFDSPHSAKTKILASKKAQMRANRKIKRENEKGGKIGRSNPRAKATKKYKKNAMPAQTKFKIEGARVTRTAYTGLPEQAREESSDVLDELVGPGSRFQFKLIPYTDGAPTPIVSNDKNKYVMGIMAGCPKDNNWESVMSEASALLEDARVRCEFLKKDLTHRRGTYATLRGGVSMGGGQAQPKNLENAAVEKALFEELNSQEPFKRLAGFATSIVATWAPNLYKHYVTNLEALHTKYPGLKRNFTCSIFEASTYNLGPQTATRRHVDYFNLPFGWCAITALGNFDYKKGGHLVLWDLGLVIEFPAGTTILIPSAVLSHSNVKIQQNETRQSFTQYTAGGIFRWIANGFQKSTSFWDKLSDVQKRVEEEKNASRWKAGLALWSKLSDIKTNNHD